MTTWVSTSGAVAARTWLTLPSQKLRTASPGTCFTMTSDWNRCGSGWHGTDIDVWLSRLAAGWTRIGQEDFLMDTVQAEVGDDLARACRRPARPI